MMPREQRERLSALYEEHSEAVRLAALAKRLPREETEDAVQDTFCRFMDFYGKEFDRWNEKQIRSALMRIAYNRCADYYRKRQRHPDTSIEQCVSEEEYRPVAELTVPDVGEQVERKEELARVREWILEMSPAMKDVATLCLLEGRPVEEVCRILNIREGACRMRLCRARRRLLERMGGG